MKRPWAQDEAVLRELYPVGVPNAVAAALPRRTKGAIIAHACKMGIKAPQTQRVLDLVRRRDPTLEQIWTAARDIRLSRKPEDESDDVLYRHRAAVHDHSPRSYSAAKRSDMECWLLDEVFEVRDYEELIDTNGLLERDFW